METDVDGASSFSDTEETAPQTFTEYLDTICPYYLMYGMTWDEFWNGSIDRYEHYWQKHQFGIERRNQELWLQGLYIMEAVSAVLDRKHRVKYPEKPHRITKLTKAEQEVENANKVSTLREQLSEIKRRWDAKHKGAS